MNFNNHSTFMVAAGDIFMNKELTTVWELGMDSH